MGFRHPATWIILITLVVLLFGASRLPDITRNLGKSLKIFKEEVRDLQEDTGRAIQSADPQAQPPTQPAPGTPETPTSTPPQAPTPPTDHGN